MIDHFLLRRATSAVLLALAVLTGVLAIVDTQGSFRLLVTVAFLIMGPGWAVAAYLPKTELAMVWIVAVGVGVGLALVLSVVMVRTGQWYPTLGLLVLVVASLPPLVHHVLRKAPVEAHHR